MKTEDMAQVLRLTMGVWDHALELAKNDGIPTNRQTEIASAMLEVFLDGVQLPQDQLAQRMGCTYVALAREILNGGK